MGACSFVILLNVHPLCLFPLWLRVFAQMLRRRHWIGHPEKVDLYELKRMFFPVLIMLVCMVPPTCSLAQPIYALSYLDITTSLFAKRAGRITDQAHHLERPM